MFRQCLRSTLLKRPLTNTRPLNHTWQKLPSIIPPSHTRLFHASRPSKLPLFPPLVLGLLKTGKLVNLLSLSSKVSLTLLPHTFRRGAGTRAETLAKILVGVPVVGFTLLAVIGLDTAPNTSRLRLSYLSDEEAEEMAHKEVLEIFANQLGLIADAESEKVIWLQTIADNLSYVAVDDVRAPVRQYRDTPVALTTENDDDEEEEEEEDDTEKVDLSAYQYTPPRYPVVMVNDDSVVNAMCIGRTIVVYNLMVELFDYDPEKMAVILSHEVAHSIQKHFVEQHGLASLMFMFTDIARSVLWVFTEALGPHVNELITNSISGAISLETNRTYNRSLEKEADLVGLKLLAKAGYNPRAAVEVWERMNELHEAMISFSKGEDTSGEKFLGSSDSDEAISSYVDAWFGSTHPPDKERIEYIKENMDEAIRIYEETLEINGPAVDYEFSEEFTKEKVVLNKFDLLEMLELREHHETI